MTDTDRQQVCCVVSSDFFYRSIKLLLHCVLFYLQSSPQSTVQAKKPCVEKNTLFIYIGSVIVKFKVEELLFGQKYITWYSNIGTISLKEMSGGAYDEIHCDLLLLQKCSILAQPKEINPKVPRFRRVDCESKKYNCVYIYEHLQHAMLLKCDV